MTIVWFSNGFPSISVDDFHTEWGDAFFNGILVVNLSKAEIWCLILTAAVKCFGNRDVMRSTLLTFPFVSWVAVFSRRGEVLFQGHG